MKDAKDIEIPLIDDGSHDDDELMSKILNDYGRVYVPNGREWNITDPLREGLAGAIRQLLPNNVMEAERLESLIGLPDDSPAIHGSSIMRSMTQEQRDNLLRQEAASNRRNNFLGLADLADWIEPEKHQMPDSVLGSLGYEALKAIPSVGAGVAEFSLLGPSGFAGLNTMLGSQNAQNDVYSALRKQGQTPREARENIENSLGGVADTALRAAANAATIAAFKRPIYAETPVSPLIQFMDNVFTGSTIAGAGAAAEQALTNYRSNVDNTESVLNAGRDTALGAGLGGLMAGLLNLHGLRDIQEDWKSRQPITIDGRDITPPDNGLGTGNTPPNTPPQSPLGGVDITGNTPSDLIRSLPQGTLQLPEYGGRSGIQNRYNSAITPRGFTPISNEFSPNASAREIAAYIGNGYITHNDAVDMLGEAGLTPQQAEAFIQTGANEIAPQEPEPVKRPQVFEFSLDWKDPLYYRPQEEAQPAQPEQPKVIEPTEPVQTPSNEPTPIVTPIPTELWTDPLSSRNKGNVPEVIPMRDFTVETPNASSIQPIVQNPETTHDNLSLQLPKVERIPPNSDILMPPPYETQGFMPVEGQTKKDETIIDKIKRTYPHLPEEYAKSLADWLESPPSDEELALYGFKYGENGKYVPIKESEKPVQESKNPQLAPEKNEPIQGAITDELERIIKEENLKPEETRNFINRALQEGKFKPIGTDFDKLMPPMSLFRGDRSQTLARVKERLGDFVERKLADKQSEQNPTPDTSSPHVRLAENVKSRVLDVLKNDEAEIKPFSNNELLAMASEVFGGTKGEGKFDPSDAYDALELGVNLAIKEAGIDPSKAETIDDVVKDIRKLSRLLQAIPTQTTRTEEKIKFQQFSTPPTLAYLVNWLANIHKGNNVLEPSAGTGNLAIFAHNSGAELTLNELTKRRADILDSFKLGNVYRENAEHIADILLPKLGDNKRPDRVVMNPPFSAAGNRGVSNSNTNGFRHVEQALQLMKDGGRLVAILGSGRDGKGTSVERWLNSHIAKKYNVRAIINSNGKAYQKYGTNFGNIIAVIDKNGATPKGETKHFTFSGDFGNESDVRNLFDSLSEIRGDKYLVGEPVTSLLQGRKSVIPTIDDLVNFVMNDVHYRNALKSRPDEPDAIRTALQATLYPIKLGREMFGDIFDSYNVEAIREATDYLAQFRDDNFRKKIEDEVFERTYTRGREQKEPTKEPVTSPTKKETSSVPKKESGIETDRKNITQSDNQEPNNPTPEEVNAQVTPKESGQKISVERKKSHVDKTKDNDSQDESILSAYSPTYTIKGAKSHPADLVEATVLRAVPLPDIKETPYIPESVINDGKLSDAQLEAVTLAVNSFSHTLPNGTTRGFFIGDGTGVGKGREISGIIMDTLARGLGKGKAVWVSEKHSLVDDAKRDWNGLGNNANEIFAHKSINNGKPIERKNGILFSAYSYFDNKDRITQLKNWIGQDFDGIIVLDEAHNVNNVLGKSPSKRATNMRDFIKTFPKARVLYVSATGATELANFAMLDRLGLWGYDNAPFINAKHFTERLADGGIAAMEVAARDLKAMGLYISRSLSMRAGPNGGDENVTFRTLEHELTDYEIQVYDTLARAWQTILQNIEKALAACGAKNGDGGGTGRAKSIFWGAHQRFFNQVITSFKVPEIIKDIEKELKKGNSAIIQLTNTNEAALNRAIGNKKGKKDDNLPDDGFDLSPKALVIDFLQKSFPIQKMEEIVTEDGDKRMVPVYEADNVTPVISQEAVRLRDDTIKLIESIKAFPNSPIDMILDYFGHNNVAEITGRTKRPRTADNGATVIENRTKRITKAEIDDFNNGKRRILIFSEAGGTGASYHASKDFKNQQKRKHYLLQPGWRAATAVQGLGRSNRSHQAHKPEYILTTTDLPGEKRFMSTIAKRIQQLGALTSGERASMSGGLFSEEDNLEAMYIPQAVTNFFRHLRENYYPDLNGATVFEQLGLPKDNDSKFLDVTTFLNRILSMEYAEQKKAFARFMGEVNSLKEFYEAQGELDKRTETVKALKISIKQDRLINHDEGFGTDTRYVELQLTQPMKVRTWQSLVNAEQDVDFYTLDSGKIIAVYKSEFQGVDKTTGMYFDKYNAVQPDARKIEYGLTEEILTNANPNQKRHFTKLNDMQEAKRLWEKQCAELPSTTTETKHMITGALLPVWTKLEGKPRIWRVVTDNGDELLGRLLTAKELSGVLGSFNINYENKESYTPETLRNALDKRGTVAKLFNGSEIKFSTVNGEKRLEFIASDPFMKWVLGNKGALKEFTNGKERIFFPNGNDDTLNYVLKEYPIVNISETDDADYLLDDFTDKLNLPRLKSRGSRG